MIDQALNFLKTQLNAYLQQRTGSDTALAAFLEEAQGDACVFPLDVVTVLLVNVEQDRTNRMMPSGRLQGQTPAIDLNLGVLFVCRFTDYAQGLGALSLVVEFFQGTPVFERSQFPTLDARIQKLCVELNAMPFAEQNEVWSSLRTSYLPSVLYKVRMLIFRGRDALTHAPEVKTVEVEMNPQAPAAQIPSGTQRSFPNARAKAREVFQQQAGDRKPVAGTSTVVDPAPQTQAATGSVAGGT